MTTKANEISAEFARRMCELFEDFEGQGTAGEFVEAMAKGSRLASAMQSCVAKRHSAPASRVARELARFTAAIDRLSPIARELIGTNELAKIRDAAARPIPSLPNMPRNPARFVLAGAVLLVLSKHGIEGDAARSGAFVQALAVIIEESELAFDPQSLARDFFSNKQAMEILGKRS